VTSTTSSDPSTYSSHASTNTPGAGGNTGSTAAPHTTSRDLYHPRPGE